MRAEYTYYKLGIPDTTKFGDGTDAKTSIKSRTLDKLGRLSSETIKTDSGTNIQVQYKYRDIGSTQTTNQVSEITYPNIEKKIEYTYDDRGNVTSVRGGSTEPNTFWDTFPADTYTYDGLDQLIKEKGFNSTREYSYDDRGNILSVKENGTVIKEYTYGEKFDSNVLLSYNGTRITYNGCGSATSWRDGMSLTWKNGRQLDSVQKQDGKSYYGYNGDGTRQYKIVNGVMTEFEYANGQLVSQAKVTRDSDGNKVYSDRIWFYYDADGTRLAMEYNGEKYYYFYDATGNVQGLFDSSGTAVANYYYTAYGEPLLIESGFGFDRDVSADPTHIANINPFRYKGYYYDTETGFYYMFSRYYDPVVSRWISQEPNVYNGEFDEGSEILGYNVYAYCFNNPINNFDPDGEAAANIVGGVIGGVVGAALGYLLADALGLKGWKKWALISAATVGGAVLGAFLGPYVAKLGSSVAAKLGIKAVPKIGSQIGRLGKLVKSTKPAIKGLTRHGLQRMAQRGVSQNMAQSIVRSGHAIAQSGGKTLYFTQAGVVVLNKAGEVVTAYSSKFFDSAMKEIIRKFYG